MDVNPMLLVKASRQLTRGLFSALINIIPLSVLLAFSMVFCGRAFSTPTLPAQHHMPIYAAYVSDTLMQNCSNLDCELNPLDTQQLNNAAITLVQADVLNQALNTSQYEVLIGNAIVKQTSTDKTLVMEITTTWRSVPIDDVVLSATCANTNDCAKQLLNTWFERVKEHEVFEAPKIYQVLQASNYKVDLTVPERIGEFILANSAVYRDPLQGSISRYTHPDFDDAIVDISVYPRSPFIALLEEASASEYLSAEINKQVTEIKALISSSGIKDFVISDVSAVSLQAATGFEQGYQVEVTLNTQSVPVYSTQYVFLKHDKIIKLSGNVPQRMMQHLVAESLPKISVPNESSFMKSMRKG